MAIKVITGKPGSGKTYFAVREVISKHFKWNDDLNQWDNVSGVTIISNIEGLRLPHLNFNQYLKENNISYRDFFTVHYFETVLIPRFTKVSILLDEAQKFFPKTFKDSRDSDSLPEKLSNHYFFEFHRHLNTDVYLIGQLWTRFAPEIVNLAEYQIDAQPRSLAVLNEFRYHFRNGFEVYLRKTVKLDKKIFALYQSTSTGTENKGQEIRPIRKLVFISLFFFAIAAGFARYTLTRISPDIKSGSPAAAQAGGQGIAAQTPSVKKTTNQQKTLAAGFVPSMSEPSTEKPLMLHQTSTQIRLGGMWVGSKLVGVEFFGKVVRVKDFTYPFHVDLQDRAVYAMVPDVVLSQVQLLQTGDYISDGQGGYQLIADRTGQRTASNLPVNADNQPVPDPRLLPVPGTVPDYDLNTTAADLKKL